jgi:translation initiation factor IF-2
MVDDRQKELTEAGPSTPVQIIGLSSVPAVGDLISSAPCVSSAQDVEESNTFDGSKVSLIIKADVQGSLEAISNHLKDQVNLVACSVGSVTDGDIVNAVASGASIIGFNSKIGSSVKKLADVENVSFKNFNIIYQLFDHVDDLVAKKKKSLEPEIVKQGTLKIIKIFNIEGQIIYGCQVTSGKVSVHDFLDHHTIVSLKKGRTDIEEAKKGEELGLVIEPIGSYTAGDLLSTYSKIDKI